MDAPPDDISMKLWGLGDRPMATGGDRPRHRGNDHPRRLWQKTLEAQRPFQVTDATDRWVIVGSQEYDEDSKLWGGQLAEGKVTVEVLKSNFRVIKFMQTIAMLPPRKQR